MEEQRISIYGIDADRNEKRMFDLVISNGIAFAETKDRRGYKVRTSLQRLMPLLAQVQREVEIFNKLS